MKGLNITNGVSCIADAGVCAMEPPLGGGVSTFSHGIRPHVFKSPVSRLAQVIEAAYDHGVMRRRRRPARQGSRIISGTSE